MSKKQRRATSLKDLDLSFVLNKKGRVTARYNAELTELGHDRYSVTIFDKLGKAKVKGLEYYGTESMIKDIALELVDKMSERANPVRVTLRRGEQLKKLIADTDWQLILKKVGDFVSEEQTPAKPRTTETEMHTLGDMVEERGEYYDKIDNDRFNRKIKSMKGMSEYIGRMYA